MRILSLFFCLFCCITQSFAQSPIYTEDKLGITVSSDQPEFIVKLKSNPTTGYTWFLREYPDFLVPIKHDYQAPDTKLMGASGYEIWKFKAKREAFTVPQQSELRFIYARPWEGEDQPKEIVFRVSTISAGSASRP